MKKWIGLLVAVAMIAAGCDNLFGDESGSDGSSVSTNLAGVWDLLLVPSGNGSQEYLVTVETGGGSGVARVSIVGPLVSDLVTVVAGVDNPIGTCGMFIRFGASAEAISLVVGDSWTVQVTGAIPLPPTPAPANTSAVSLVQAWGLDCLPAACDGSALAAAVPAASGGAVGAGVGGGQWLSVVLSQSGPQVWGFVPEQHVLSLNLGPVLFPPAPALIAEGDTVTVSYRRRVTSDGANGDFFRAVITNGALTPDAEYLAGGLVPAGDTVVSYTFTAKSDTVWIEFIAGLSDPGESAQVDEVRVSTAALGTIFTDGFDTGPGPACTPTNSRWRVRSPVWEVGTMCVSAAGPLAGSHSARWSGGSYREISGSVLGGGSGPDLSELMGGGSSALAGSMTGVLMEAVETRITYFLTTFFVAGSGANVIAGTFRGEANDHSCTETGTITGTRHVSQEADAASLRWVVRLSGEATNCTPAASGTIAFDYLLETLAGDTHIPMNQAGTALSADGPVQDPDTNQYLMAGTASGPIVTLSLTSVGGVANGTGVFLGTNIQGALSGKLMFDSGRVCNLSDTSAFEATLVPP